MKLACCSCPTCSAGLAACLIEQACSTDGLKGIQPCIQSTGGYWCHIAIPTQELNPSPPKFDPIHQQAKTEHHRAMKVRQLG